MIGDEPDPRPRMQRETRGPAPVAPATVDDAGDSMTDLLTALQRSVEAAKAASGKPAEEEPAEAVSARARAFRGEMAARPDWAHTVVVSHWGFILALTGVSVNNGEWLRCDPTGPHPEAVVWRHG